VQRVNNSYYTSVPIGDFPTPVGAGIQEVGQNANGTYLKFSDGALIQYGTTALSIPITHGDAWYALAFAVAPIAGTHNISLTLEPGGHWNYYTSGGQYTSGGFNVHVHQDGAAQTIYAHWFMIARWK
jgi:phage baseplate assembly protein gpV